MKTFIGVYSVKDKLTGLYGAPQLFHSRIEAVRAFVVVATDGDSLIRARPTDFSLYFHGVFWQDSGMLDSIDPDFVTSADGAVECLQSLIDALEGSEDGN